MDEETILDGFMDGFAKTAEDAGLHGTQVMDLLLLSADLAQQAVSPDAFATGFAAGLGGA